jgi:hypothetical protein
MEQIYSSEATGRVLSVCAVDVAVILSSPCLDGLLMHRMLSGLILASFDTYKL